MSARFVILTHDHPFLHWDLMLDWGPVLRSWRLLEQPNAPGPVAAQAIGDHRRAYLDYQGPVSGGRGQVAQWDAGMFAIISESPDALTLVMRGNKLDGQITLARGEGDDWTFVAGGSIAQA